MLRFTIRDVLWLTVVAALAIGWWWDRFRLDDELRAFIETQVQFAKSHNLNFDIHGGRVIFLEP